MKTWLTYSKNGIYTLGINIVSRKQFENKYWFDRWHYLKSYYHKREIGNIVLIWRK